MKHRIHPHRQTRRRAALAVNAGLLGTGMVALAGATGKLGQLRDLIEELPLPEPGPNGWPLLVLLVLGGGCWWRMVRAVTTAHEAAELAPRRERRDNEKWPAEPLAGCQWPAGDPGNPWFGPVPFDQGQAPPRRRTQPVRPAGDLDPDEARPVLLPVADPDEVRS